MESKVNAPQADQKSSDSKKPGNAPKPAAKPGTAPGIEPNHNQTRWA